MCVCVCVCVCVLPSNVVGCSVSVGLLLDWLVIESILYLIFRIFLDVSIVFYFGIGHFFFYGMPIVVLLLLDCYLIGLVLNRSYI